MCDWVKICKSLKRRQRITTVYIRMLMRVYIPYDIYRLEIFTQVKQTCTRPQVYRCCCDHLWSLIHFRVCSGWKYRTLRTMRGRRWNLAILSHMPSLPRLRKWWTAFFIVFSYRWFKSGSRPPPKILGDVPPRSPPMERPHLSWSSAGSFQCRPLQERSGTIGRSTRFICFGSIFIVNSLIS